MVTACTWFYYFFMICALVGCGYHFEQPLAKAPLTLAIPFVDEDRDGVLTQALVHAISWRSPFVYRSAGASYLLRVKLDEMQSENIGFRYDATKKDKQRRSIIPTEMRLQIAAEVSLYSALTGEVFVEPTRISATLEFDHDYYSICGAVNVFSLGQVNDVDAAREEATRLLKGALARKIADFLALYSLP